MITTDLVDLRGVGRAELERRIVHLVTVIDSIEQAIVERIRNASLARYHPNVGARAEAEVRQQAYRTVLEDVRTAIDSLTTVDNE